MTTNLIHNAFLDDIGTDFVALNPAGVPVGRAGTREALEQAHAGADVTIHSAADLPNLANVTIAEAATASLEGPFAAVVAQGVKDPDGNEPQDAAPAKDPFDHDGKDGPGGSLPGKDSTAHKGAAQKAAAKK